MKYWTPEEDAILYAGIKANLTWQAIGEKFPDRTSRVCRFRAERLGIRPNRKATDELPCPKSASAELRDRMEQQFHDFARKHRVEYVDARTLLMDTGVNRPC